MTSKILIIFGIIIALTFAALPVTIEKQFNASSSLKIEFKTSTSATNPLTVAMTLINPDTFDYNTFAPGAGGAAYAICGVLSGSNTMTANQIVKGFVIDFHCGTGKDL